MKRAVVCLVIAGLLFLPTGCHSEAPLSVPATETSELPRDTPFPVPETPDAPAGEIGEWVEYSRDLFLAQVRLLDGKLHLLVTYGVKPTGGYSVKIGEVVEQTEKIIVQVEFKKPAEDEVVSQSITRPYDLIEIAVTAKPVEFVAQGDEEYVPTLLGLDYLPPLAAQSDGIKIIAPAPHDVVSGRLGVKGVANVFEGNVLYRLFDSRGEIIESGFTTAAMGDWGYFELKLVLPQAETGGEKLLLELYTESAKDGSEQDKVRIDVTLK